MFSETNPTATRDGGLSRKKGGKQHSMPCHHALAEALRAYIDAAGIVDDRKGWLFRTARGHNGTTLSEASTLLQRQSYVGHSQDTGREGSL